jgi:hypothetical protein
MYKVLASLKKYNFPKSRKIIRPGKEDLFGKEHRCRDYRLLHSDKNVSLGALLLLLLVYTVKKIGGNFPHIRK